MISEAVEEVLNLVQDATQKFKSMMSTESEDLAQESHSSTVRSNGQGDESSSANQQQDWSSE